MELGGDSRWASDCTSRQGSCVRTRQTSAQADGTSRQRHGRKDVRWNWNAVKHVYRQSDQDPEFTEPAAVGMRVAPHLRTDPYGRC